MIVTLVLFVACGGGKAPAPVTNVTVRITPPSGGSAVYGMDHAQFGAVVTGTSNAAVTWNVSETNGGTISAAGLYTAPPRAGTFHVTATSQADPAQHAIAAVSVTIAVPAFSGTPPATALEGSTYTYVAAATDPAGTGVCFALQGPSGSTLSGSTVSWTPSPAQSRIANSFALTATTGAGGTRTQSWTVMPNGTIHISYIDTFWSADGEGVLGSQPRPNDLSDSNTYRIEALVPQSDGSVVRIDGIGKSNGTATISNVPGGAFWLQVRPGEMYFTSSSVFDYGADYIGRAPATPLSATLEWEVSSLLPWDSNDNDSLLLSVPNAGVSFVATSLPQDGSTVDNSEEPYSGPLIDPGSGDTGYVMQKRYRTTSGLAEVGMISMASASGLAIRQNGDTGEVSSVMAPASPAATMDIDIVNSAYGQLASSINPNFAFAGGSGELLVQPLVSNLVAQGGVSLLDFAVSDISQDQNLGTFTYGNPFPTAWDTLFSYTQAGKVALPVPNSRGATVDAWGSLASVSATIPSASQPNEPAMSPVRNAQLNGADFFAASTISGAISLVWEPPTGSAPAGYAVAAYPVEEDSQGYYLADGVVFYSSSTSLQIPSGVLPSGKMYVFVITGIADARANFATSPWRSGYPLAWADAVSGIVIYIDPGNIGWMAERRETSPRPLLATASQSLSRKLSGAVARSTLTDYRRSQMQRALQLRNLVAATSAHNNRTGK